MDEAVEGKGRVESLRAKVMKMDLNGTEWRRWNEESFCFEESDDQGREVKAGLHVFTLP